MGSLTAVCLVLAMILFLQSAVRVRAFQPTSSSALRMMLSNASSKKGKLLVLGGTGFLGQTICKRAVVEGYAVTSVSRRGVLPDMTPSSSIDYRKGDAREKETIASILNEGGYTGTSMMNYGCVRIC